MVNRNKVIYADLLILSLLVTGCGGSGSGTGITNSVFAGSYTGTWSNSTSGGNGPATIAISSQGILAGTFHDNVANADDTVDAVIDNSGNVTGSIVLPGSNSVAISGTLAVNSSSHLAGSLTETSGGVAVGTLVVDLIKQ